MATTKKAANPVIDAATFAAFQKFQKMQSAGGAPAPIATEKPVKAPKANVAQVAIDAAINSVGGKLIRFGAQDAHATDKCYTRWADVKIGNLRVQGNLYVSKKSA